MTKGFSEGEKEQIKKALMESGKALFTKYGLKKTSIKNLTEAVGIAQGSFYNFFESKEELLFEIFEHEENKIRKNTEIFMQSEDKGEDFLKKLLKTSFEYIDQNEILIMMQQGDELQAMLRKLPPEKMERHIKNDSEYLLPMIDEMKKTKNMVDLPTDVIGGVFRSITMLTLYKKEIGAEVYPQVISFLIDVISTGLTKGGKGND